MGKNNLKIKKTHKNGCLFKMIWLIFIFFTSALVAKYMLTSINDMLALNREKKSVVVNIPEDANIDLVAKTLKESGLITREEFFKIYAYVTKSHKGFETGDFELDTDMDYEQILSHLKNNSNKKKVVEITFTEGMNILECSELLEKNAVCKKEELLKMCNSDAFDSKYNCINVLDKNKLYYKLEGYLFPDTYQFYVSESPQKVIEKVLNNFIKKVDAESLKYKNYTTNDIITIASLIQSEASDEEDMHKVSSVIHNRLNTLPSGKSKFNEFGFGTLKIDSTVWYPYKNKQSIPKDKIKNFTSKFDTYNISGLPAGPICNPGLDAIHAAITPASTDYYYYCHSHETGQAYYAKTNDVHIANLKRAGLT